MFVTPIALVLLFFVAADIVCAITVIRSNRSWRAELSGALLTCALWLLCGAFPAAAQTDGALIYEGLTLLGRLAVPFMLLCAVGVVGYAPALRMPLLTGVVGVYTLCGALALISDMFAPLSALYSVLHILGGVAAAVFLLIAVVRDKRVLSPVSLAAVCLLCGAAVSAFAPPSAAMGTAAVCTALAAISACVNTIPSPVSKTYAALEGMPGAVLAIDLSGRVMDINPAALMMLGLKREDQIVQKSAVDVIPSWPSLPEDLAQEVVLPLTLIDDDGVHRSVTLQSTPMRGSGGSIAGRVIVLQGVVEERDAKRETYGVKGRDMLTSLVGTELFLDLLQQELYRTERSGKRIGVMLLGITDWKILNESMDKRASELLIYEIAHRLRRHMRKTDIVARLDENRFAVAMTQIDSPMSVMTGLITRLFDNIRAPFYIAERKVSVPFCLGATIAPDDGNEAKRLLTNANLALAYAEASGANRYYFYSGEMNALTAERFGLASMMREAIGKDECDMLYEPVAVMEGANFGICGVKAALRWHNETLAAVDGDRLMSIADEFGLITPLGMWVMRECVRALRSFAQAGIDDMTMTFGVSLKQLYMPNLPMRLQALLAGDEKLYKRIILCIPEGAAMSANPTLTENLRKLRATGARLCVDRFGSGSATLHDVCNFNVDMLSLDTALYDADGDYKSAAVLRSISTLADELGLVLRAERVKDETQAALFSRMGCLELQGSYIGGSMTAEACLSLYAAGDMLNFTARAR